MTTLIIVLFVFLILNIIHHLTTIEQLKKVKRNQHDILDLLEDNDLYLKTIEDELYNIKQLEGNELVLKTIEDELHNIKQSINNIPYTNRNQ